MSRKILTFSVVAKAFVEIAGVVGLCVEPNEIPAVIELGLV